jgi:hypothetical protein
MPDPDAPEMQDLLPAAPDPELFLTFWGNIVCVPVSTAEDRAIARRWVDFMMETLRRMSARSLRGEPLDGDDILPEDLRMTNIEVNGQLMPVSVRAARFAYGMVADVLNLTEWDAFPPATEGLTPTQLDFLKIGGFVPPACAFA